MTVSWNSFLPVRCHVLTACMLLPGLPVRRHEFFFQGSTALEVAHAAVAGWGGTDGERRRRGLAVILAQFASYFTREAMVERLVLAIMADEAMLAAANRVCERMARVGARARGSEMVGEGGKEGESEGAREETGEEGERKEGEEEREGRRTLRELVWKESEEGEFSFSSEGAQRFLEHIRVVKKHS